MESMVRDLRYALRHWAKKPGLTALIVITLALGVGANAAIFSVVDAVLLAPLPFPESERLVAIHTQFPAQKFDRFWVSAPEYLELARWNTSFEVIGAYRTREANLGAPEEPLRVQAARASASLFTVLGRPPLRGRVFTPEEDLPDSTPVVVLSEGLWRRAFDADEALLGKTVEVDGRAHTVVGVMPASFDLEDAGIELWAPLALNPASPGGRGGHFLRLIGRLRADKSLEQARGEIAALLPRWRQEMPDTHVPSVDNHPFYLESLKENLVGASRTKMAVLAGAVCLVLLVACANVANLLLARAEARQREVALRTALGAGRGRLARQFLTESVLLAVAGGGLGLVVAVVGVNAILAANPGSVVRVDEVSLSPRLLGYTLAVALATGLLFGMAPALHTRARSFFGGLKDGVRSTSGRGRLRSALVVAEVALAFVLTVGAGLMLKSFQTLNAVSPGFEPEGLLTFQLSMPPARYADLRDGTALYDRLITNLSALPGVTSVGAMSGLPPRRDIDANDTDFEGVPQPPDGPIHNVDYYNAIAGDYFRAMKIPLLAGRLFEPADAESSSLGVVVNQRLAEVFWPGQDPIGKRLRPYFSADAPWFTVIGVVGNVKQGGLDQPAGTELFVLNRQLAVSQGAGYRTLNLVLRTGGEPLALAAAVRAEVARIDPSLPVARLRPLAEVISGSTAGSRLMTLLVVLFGALSLVLAAVGTYGVLSYAVEERRHEMGVRLALGSEAGALLSLVLQRGFAWVGAGLVLGLAGAWFAVRLLRTVLFEVAPTDPFTWGAVAALLLVVALFACLVPAVRASRVDPVVVLRQT